MGKRRGRGEGSVEHLADGRWCAVASLGIDPATGKRRRRKFYGKTKQAALARLHEFMQSRSQGLATEARSMTVEQWSQRWLPMKQGKVQTRTYAPYEQHCRTHINPHIGQVLLSKLTALHVQELYDKLSRAGVSAALQRKVGTTLRMMLRDACRWRLLSHNVAADVAQPKAAKRDFRVLDRAQVPAFLEAAAADRFYPLYLLALDSGMRQGELFGLHWPQLDLERGMVSVVQSLEEHHGRHRLKDVKTKKGRRQILLSRKTVKVLLDFRKKQTQDNCDTATGPVFINRKGNYLSKTNLLHRSFRPILERAKLPAIRFNDLRHTCATLLLQEGVNIKVVSERLGHASIELTLNTYSHVLPGMQQAATTAMEGLLSGTCTIVPQQATIAEFGLVADGVLSYAI